MAKGSAMNDELDETIVWVPLFDFKAPDRAYELAPGLKICRLREIPDVAGQERYLPQLDQMLLPGVSHWLNYQHSPKTGVRIAEISNLVLLALWLVEPTRTHVRARFVKSLTVEGKNQLQHDWSHFQYVEGAVKDSYTDEQLERVAMLYSVLLAARLKDRRLHDALQLTMNGCVAYQWTVAIVCHVAAFETLLTFSRDGGLMQRLCTAYACLTETDLAARNRAYREAEYVYDCRSEIMHGRMSGIAKDKRLARVRDVQLLLRKLWVRILSDREALAALDEPDAIRYEYLNRVMVGFTAPGTGGGR